MRQQLSKGALRTRDRFFAALRTMSLRDVSTARLARRVEHEINEVLFQIERFAVTQKRVSVRSPAAAARIAAKWLELAAECVEIDTDLADVVTLFARHWLLCQVAPERSRQWVQRAECAIRLLSVRGEHRRPDDVRDVPPVQSEQPLLTLVLRGLPRAAQPLDVEVDLGDGAVIGRASDCDWLLPGEVVSRHHAKLRYDAGRRAFFITNLSKNGIGIDAGLTLQEGGQAEISVGSMLRIPKEGHYKILVQSVFVPLSALSATGIDFGDAGPAEDRHDGTAEEADAQSQSQALYKREPQALHPGEPQALYPGEPQALYPGEPQALAQDQPRAPYPGEPRALARALPVWADEVRDPTGLVQRVYEQYAFLPAEAGIVMREYVYGNGDAAALIAAVFADVVVAPR